MKYAQVCLELVTQYGVDDVMAAEARFEKVMNFISAASRFGTIPLLKWPTALMLYLFYGGDIAQEAMSFDTEFRQIQR